MTSLNAALKQTDDRSQNSVEEAFETLLDHLWERYDFDFTKYQRPSLMRQTRRRMQVVGVAHYLDYIEYLNAHPKEFAALFQSFPVNFTDFFRDPQIWNYLETVVIPHIIARKAPDEMIRVWSAGCASGEEAYTLAILLIEALGIEQFKKRVQIYGTDISAEAIAHACQGLYSIAQVEDIAPVLRTRYFEQVGNCYRFCPLVGRSIVFRQRNLLENAPLSQVDLLLCRNTLMYFNLEGKIRALVRFYFGLRKDGFLVLGDSESLVHSCESTLFAVVQGQPHVYLKNFKACTPKLLTQAFRRKKHSDCKSA
jgi:two-component system CheB/CheR fusion protein